MVSVCEPGAGQEQPQAAACECGDGPQTRADTILILCYAMLCYAMLYYAMPCHAMLRYALPCHAMLRYAMLCYNMLS